jgi:hypothetical protein
MAYIGLGGGSDNENPYGGPSQRSPNYFDDPPAQPTAPFDPYAQYKTTFPYQQIEGAYKTYLGREGSPEEILSHLGGGKLTSYDSINWALKNIQQSPEALAWQQRQQQPAAGTPATPTTPTPNPSPSPSPGPYAPQAAPSAGSNPNVFTDPATVEWEKALRAMVDRLNQPANIPDYAPLTDYMRKYIAQLQQPGHSPAQQDLIQTQTLDPLERQRTAARQQVVQRLAARGIAPSSGIVEKALEDVDQQFNQMRTGAQAKFATDEIDLNRQNADKALQVGGQLAGLQAGLFSGDEQRSRAAVDMLKQLPQFADSRLQLALATLGAGNVNSSLFSNLQGFLQQGMNQQGADQNYYAQIANIIAQIFGGAR